MATKSLFKKTDLDSGLRVVSEQMPGVRSASLGIWVTVGSRHESASENGISHFIEHMAFKGTKSRTAYEIARTIERGGGHINAFTSKELTCFYVHVLDEQLPLAFDILSDILQNSLYEPAEMEKEKQVILDEIRDHEDMPDDLAFEHFVKNLFGKHPLARPILGPADNVKRFSREDVKSFVERHYTPKRILIAAAGNIRHDKLVKLVEKGLNVNRRGGVPKLEKVSGTPKGVHRYPRPIQQAHMVMGTQGLPYKSKDRIAASMLNTVLGGGMSSRLFQNIREKHGVAYAIYSFSESLMDTGYVGVYLATDPGKVDFARELVLKEMNKLRETPLTSKELTEVKTQFKGGLMLGLESVSSRMMRLARMELYLGRYVSLEEISDLIDEVTPKRIQKLANELLVENKMVTAIVEPEPKKNGSVPTSSRKTARANR